MVLSPRTTAVGDGFSSCETIGGGSDRSALVEIEVEEIKACQLNRNNNYILFYPTLNHV